MQLIKSKTSETNGYKIIRVGDSYGLNDCLIHYIEEPMIEFYKNDFMINRYYLSTFFEVEGDGLCLMGDQRQYDLDFDDVLTIQEEVKEMDL